MAPKEAVKKRFEEAFFYILGDKFVLGGPSLQDLGEPKGLDPAKAFCLFQEMAEEGYIVAKFFVGLMLYIGLGTECDREQGEQCLKKSQGRMLQSLLKRFAIWVNRKILFGRLL